MPARLLCLLLCSGILPGQTTNPRWHEASREAIDVFLLRAPARLSITLLAPGEPTATAAGDFVFGYGGQPHDDPSSPNPAFFQHLDWVLKRSQGKGITVAVLPVDPGSALANHVPPEKWLDWGRYLGRRYMKVRRLVWLKPENAGPLAAIYEGIRHFDSVHPVETLGGKR